jgi:HAE1 family hydrophobic/amphiphilic exporter-1
MLTALTTILGMLPIALGFGSGGEILQPLGVAVCGGLWVSTLLTIFAVPLGIWLFAKPSAH